MLSSIHMAIVKTIGIKLIFILIYLSHRSISDMNLLDLTGHKGRGIPQTMVREGFSEAYVEVI